MKNVTILAEQMSDTSLSAALPPEGIVSVTVLRTRSSRTDAAAAETYVGFRNPQRFNPTFRIELVVDDDAVEQVFDSVSFAYGAGFFSDAEMWVDGPALVLSA